MSAQFAPAPRALVPLTAHELRGAVAMVSWAVHTSMSRKVFMGFTHVLPDRTGVTVIATNGDAAATYRIAGRTAEAQSIAANKRIESFARMGRTIEPKVAAAIRDFNSADGITMKADPATLADAARMLHGSRVESVRLVAVADCEAAFTGSDDIVRDFAIAFDAKVPESFPSTLCRSRHVIEAVKRCERLGGPVKLTAIVRKEEPVAGREPREFTILRLSCGPFRAVLACLRD